MPDSSFNLGGELLVLPNDMSSTAAATRPDFRLSRFTNGVEVDADVAGAEHSKPAVVLDYYGEERPALSAWVIANDESMDTAVRVLFTDDGKVAAIVIAPEHRNKVCSSEGHNEAARGWYARRDGDYDNAEVTLP